MFLPGKRQQITIYSENKIHVIGPIIIIRQAFSERYILGIQYFNFTINTY